MDQYQQLDTLQLVKQMTKGNVRTIGRTDRAHPFVFWWTGSGMLVTVRAGEVWADVETDYGENEIWADILIDGAPVQRLMLPRGRSRICLMRHLDPSVTRTISILRDTQPMPEDRLSFFRVNGIELDGTLEVTPAKQRRIEFIGDSITSGEGLCGAPGEAEWAPYVYNAVESYPFLTAKKLDAEYHILSQSGWGCWCDWTGNRRNVMPRYYEQVCGVVGGIGSTRWDFSCWQPDAVVINLGTNDLGALESGTVDSEEFHAGFHSSAKGFLQKIRECNRNALIIWAYGMLGNGLEKDILAAVREYQDQTGDPAVHYLRLPETKEEQFGSRRHPGQNAHEEAADALASFLKAELPLF